MAELADASDSKSDVARRVGSNPTARTIERYKMEKAQELQHLLNKLDVPEKRKNDFDWLSRNLLIRNKGEDAERALELVKHFLK